MHEYEGKISNLIDYKNSKLSEEKDLKSKNKKVEKKLKALVEKEAKVELEKRKVERLLGSSVHEIASNKTSSTTDLNSNLGQSGSVQESAKPKSNQSIPPDQPSTPSGSRAPSSPCTEKTPNAYESSSKLVKAGLEKKLGEVESDCLDQTTMVSCTLDSTNTNNTSLNPVSSPLDSTNMDPVFNTNADPTSSANQDECSLEQTELLGLLEAFCERTEKKFDDFSLKFMSSLWSIYLL